MLADFYRCFHSPAISTGETAYTVLHTYKMVRQINTTIIQIKLLFCFTPFIHRTSCILIHWWSLIPVFPGPHNLFHFLIPYINYGVVNCWHEVCVRSNQPAYQLRFHTWYGTDDGYWNTGGYMTRQENIWIAAYKFWYKHLIINSSVWTAWTKACEESTLEKDE